MDKHFLISNNNLKFKSEPIKIYKSRIKIILINLIGNFLKKKSIFLILLKSLFILSYYLYYLSLEKCYEGFDRCGVKINWISLKLFEAIFSILILVLLIECMFYNIISKLNIIHIILYYYIIFKYSHGLDFQDHGFYNFFGCIIVLFLSLLFLIPINLLIYLIKKNKKKEAIIYIFIVLVLIIIYYCFFLRIYLNCNDWSRGLNNTYIENNSSVYACQIQFPKYCPYKFGSYFLDLTKIQDIKCEENKNVAKLKLLKFSNKKFINLNTSKIGFPPSNKNKQLFLAINDNTNSIYHYVKNNLVDMDNKKLVKNIYKDNIPEIVVDFSNNKYGEIKISIHFNKSLSEERKKLENKSFPFSKNIMVIYIDSVSRAFSMRKLKKSLKFIEKFMPYKGCFNPKYPSENYHSFQFFKYHSFSSYTRYNYMQIFYGNRYKEADDKNMVRITRYLKEFGYITGYINDMCLREPTNTGHNLNFEEICDHELLLCDPNMKSVYSHKIRCLYNKISTEYAYEYATQFWEKYKNNRKFLAIITNDGHEGTLEVLKYIDEILFNFLNNLYNNNSFKDSTIFLLSDHGTAAPSPYYINEFFQLERHLPMLYMICNDRKNITYKEQYEFIKRNQQILITGYDIYNTFGYLILGDKYELIENKDKKRDTLKSRFGLSLFNEINPKERSPKKYFDMNINICK